MSLMDKSDLFFHDYSIAPLFVQENYLHVKPVAAGRALRAARGRIGVLYTTETRALCKRGWEWIVV